MAEIEKNPSVVALPSGSCGEVEGRDQGASSKDDRALAEGEADVPVSSSQRDYDPPREASDAVQILYTNWRGETAVRTILLSLPRAVLMFGSDQWHPEPQWLLAALDVEKRTWRNFALSGIRAWGDEAVAAASSPIHMGEGIALMEQLQRELGVVGPANVLRAALKVAKDAAAQAMEARQGGDAEGGSVVDDSAITEDDVPASISAPPDHPSPTPPEGDLEVLSRAATQGRWSGGYYCDGSIRATVDGEHVGICNSLSAEDATYIKALVNAYRSGRLVEAPTPPGDLIQVAREEDFQCPECHCRSCARVDEQKPDRSFGPGPLIRCVNCKRTFMDPQSLHRQEKVEDRPEGWVLVPRKPTLAMQNAGWREIIDQDLDPDDVEIVPIYRAMLSASPRPSQERQG